MYLRIAVYAICPSALFRIDLDDDQKNAAGKSFDSYPKILYLSTLLFTRYREKYIIRCYLRF